MFGKNRWATICIIGVLTLGITILAPGNASALKFLSFGTGSPAGTYYFLGAGFSSMINNTVKGVRVTAESTAASSRKREAPDPGRDGPWPGLHGHPGRS